MDDEIRHLSMISFYPSPVSTFQTPIGDPTPNRFYLPTGGDDANEFFHGCSPIVEENRGSRDFAGGNCEHSRSSAKNPETFEDSTSPGKSYAFRPEFTPSRFGYGSYLYCSKFWRTRLHSRTMEATLRHSNVISSTSSSKSVWIDSFPGVSVESTAQRYKLVAKLRAKYGNINTDVIRRSLYSNYHVYVSNNDDLVSVCSSIDDDHYADALYT